MLNTKYTYTKKKKKKKKREKKKSFSIGEQTNCEFLNKLRCKCPETAIRYLYYHKISKKSENSEINYRIFSCTQKEINSQSDEYLVILSTKTYVFEDNLTKY